MVIYVSQTSQWLPLVANFTGAKNVLRLMNQLGKKQKGLEDSLKIHRISTMPLHRTTCQEPSKEPTLKDESATTGGCGLAQPETIEVGDLLLGMDCDLNTSSIINWLMLTSLASTCTFCV